MEINFNQLAVTDYGSVLGREHFMDYKIKPLWSNMPAIYGPAYTVQLASGDNLMLHAAIYEAPKGSIIVVDGVDDLAAVAGGNVCAVAKERGIKGFIIDGVIRDLGEIIQMQFPVYARGVFPVPGAKSVYFEPAQPIACGGVKVKTGDMIVADIEGIAVLPQDNLKAAYDKAFEKANKEAQMGLAIWRENHEAKIKEALIQAKQAG
ncbi:diguanylate cyclase [Marinomonas sp. SBI22]|uniref:RraA family protein n=1 Tax=unclassified Marinomonas TaxID=196814 RepID=UPI0007AEEDE2|nr:MULTISPECIES: RraA family protein [unclassified Marinomonas]KZM38898.1 diguanylate cyclase [Marinomonas sp. SBI8L]KZM44846.1 diguanylate cyclase [Marinomonas sp. SBI22]